MDEKFFRNELATLLEYSNLLKKKRPPELEEAVKKILAEENNIVARINRINALDNENSSQNTGSNNYAIKKEESEKEQEQKEKKELKRVGFFQFFFHQRKVLINICQETALVTPKWLGLRYEINAETMTLLDEIKNSTMLNVLPTLQKIMDNGWKVLTPEYYNVFYYLYQFFNSLLKKFIIDKQDIEKNMEFVDSFSREFLILMKKKENLRKMREGLYIYYGNKENEEMTNFLLFIEALFDRNKKFSFLNYFLLIYSLYYKQPIDLNKLLEIKNIPDIETAKFLFIPKVKPMIQDYYSKIKEKQALLEKKLFFLKYILDEETAFLEKFIVEYGNPKFKLDFFTTDMITSCITFAKAFMAYSRPLLLSELSLYKEQEKINANIFVMVWENFIAKIQEILQEMEFHKENYKYLFVSFPTYKKFIEQNFHLSSEKDEKLCTYIYKLSELFYSFYEAFTTILYYDYKITYSDNKEMLLEKLKTRNTPITEKETERLIPYYDYQVDNYKGEKVSEVMNKIASVVGTFLYVIENNKILERLKEKKAFIEESKRNLENMMRIM